MKAKYKLKGRAQVNAPGSQKKYVLTQKGSPVLLPQRCLLPWLIKPVAPSFSCFWSLIGSVIVRDVFYNQQFEGSKCTSTQRGSCIL
ncbi:uncharacterized protein [Solanum lycopersicum]|uniref:uncharacterized protein isoform X2 n=1 Tax=Solanum lycopersicum TaxID=4081 RepID=UPI003749F83B